MREVRSAARRPATYWMRSAAGAVGGAVLFILMMQIAMGIVSGRTLFMTTIGLAFLLCLLEGVRQASTSIVEERVEGTLGLLLLTKVRGAELLLGKFAALAFFALQTLLAVAPVVAMSLILGGVSVWEVARSGLALANTLVVALTTGLIISARSREPSRAMYGTFFALGGAALILSLRFWPVAGWPGFVFYSLNPFTPVWTIADLTYKHFQKEYWISLAVTMCGATLALYWVSKRLAAELPGPPQKAEADLEIQPESALSYAEITQVQVRRSRRWFNGNPIEWLCRRNLRLHGREYGPLTLAAFIGLIMYGLGNFGFLLAMIVFLIFGFLYSAGASVTLARARQAGELELWLTTPLTIKDIMRGNLATARKAFLWPGLILLFAWCATFYFNVIRTIMTQAAAATVNVSVTGPGGTASSVSTNYWPFLYLIGSTILSMVSLFIAVPYVAMWIALKTKTPAQAAIRTFLLMFIAPWIIIGIPKVIIFVPVALVANHSVRTLLKNYGARNSR